MADETVHVGDGGHYDTLNHAITDEVAAHPILTGAGLDGILTFCCHNISDTTAADTTTGWTVDADHYLNFIGNPDDRTAANTGKWSTERYRLAPASAPALIVQEAYTRITGLQLDHTGSSNYRYTVQLKATDCRINKCIVRKSGTGDYCLGIYTETGAADIWNCIVYGYNKSNNERGISVSGDSGAQRVYHCTVFGNYAGIITSTGDGVVKNCAVFNNTDDFLGEYSSIDYCASDDADGDHHVHLNENAGSEWTNNFTDYTTYDVSLKAGGTLLIGAGVDLSATVVDDINGDARSAPVDIGADEYVAAGGGSIVPQAAYYYRRLAA